MKRLPRGLMALRGAPGHPLHPPLTDAAIGAFTATTILGFIGICGWARDAAGKGMWLCVLVGIAFAAGAAVTGLAELLALDPRTAVYRTALAHMTAMVGAVVLYAATAAVQYRGFHDGRVTVAGFVLSLVAFFALTAGGWLGGTIVFVHGQRVMSQPLRPTREAVLPVRRPLRTGRRSRRPV